MPKLEKTLLEFADLMNKGEQININTQGEWYREGIGKSAVSTVFALKEKRLVNVCSELVKSLNRLEHKPVTFNGKDKTQKYAAYIKAAKAGRNALIGFKSKEAIEASNLLQRKIIALKYRIEAVNGGEDRLSQDEVDPKLRETVSKVAKEWIAKQKIPLDSNKEFQGFVDKTVSEVSRYRKFAKILIKDHKLQSDFFGWTLKNCNPIATFIEYPAVTARLRSSLIAARIGRFSYENPLRINVKDKKHGVLEKRLELLFEGKHVNILNESKQLTFKGNYKATIKEIFDDIKNKNVDPGKFEFMGNQGIVNWNVHKMAHWDGDSKEWKSIDLNGNKWWEGLPKIESLTLDQVKKRYNIDQLEKDQWVAVAMASRQSTTLSIDNSHGYREILIPNQSGGYDLYPFGKFAKQFPTGVFNTLKFLTNTVKADLVYPDPNIFYSGFRQQAAVPFVITKEQGQKLMNERIKEDILKARSGDLVFMLAGENCAYTPQTDLEWLLGKEKDGGKVPNLYVTDLFNISIDNPIARGFVNFVKFLPRAVQSLITRIVSFVLGAWRGLWARENGRKVFKSLSTSFLGKGIKTGNNGEKVHNPIFLPSFMHKQVSDKKLKGVIWHGHHRMQKQ